MCTVDVGVGPSVPYCSSYLNPIRRRELQLYRSQLSDTRMSMLRRCRAVIFDLDDTLVPTSRIDRGAILAAAARALGEAASSSTAKSVADRFAGLLKTAPFPTAESGQDVPTWRSHLWARALQEEGPGNGNDADKSIQNAAAVTSAAQLAHDAWVEERLNQFRFADDVVAMVRRIQAAGYKTCILTNGHADVQRAKASACEAAVLFGEGRVIVAGEHEEQKPAASIFRVACEALDEAADTTIMVGDSYAADIAGAVNAGLLATVWVRPDTSSGEAESLMHGHLAVVPDGSPPPDFTVNSVLGLEAVLEKIG